MILHALISGQVQGVGFRYWALREANALGLAGYTRNMPDGRVEVEAEGAEDVLREFEQILWKGPWSGRVDNVEARYRNESKGYRTFDIRR